MMHLCVTCLWMLRLLAPAWAASRLNMFKYEESRFETVMEQVVVHPDTGHVYVGAQNMLYHFDYNLKVLNEKITGPALDGAWCSPLVETCDRAPSKDNHMSVMELYPDAPYLLVCGTLKQGICAMHHVDNIVVAQELGLNNIVNYIGSSKSAYAFFARGGTLSGGSITALYAANAYDERRMDFAQKAVSARVITQNPDGLFNISYSHENPTHQLYTFIDIDPVYKQDYIVKYIYGFEHDHFSYFLTIQKEEVHSTAYITRLARVCQDDPSFFSYTEITLNCRKSQVESIFYEVALAAHLGPVGDDLRRRFVWEQNEQVLYVVFGKQRSDFLSSDVNEAYGSGICMFPMSQVRRDFKLAQRDCYSSWGQILSWINHTQPSCRYVKEYLSSIDEDFCGAAPNVGIGGRYSLQATSNFTSNDLIMSAIGVFTYRNKTIAAMGTTDGQIVKVLLDGSYSAPYAHINVGDGTSPPAVARDIAFDNGHHHLYALTGNRVTKVQIQSCSVYTECSQCVMTRIDPLMCGWCGDHCSTQSACLTHPWAENSCPPIVNAFNPKSGPLQGGTQVTIWGENFGTSDPTIEGVSTKVQVALVPCAIEFHNETLIICATGEADKDREREVRVTVVDRTMQTVPYIIEGFADTNHDSYYYKNTSMHVFTPSRGPQSGGTSLTIAGYNLNIGSQLQVKVGHLPCDPMSVELDQIICNTTRWVPELDFNQRIRRAVQAEIVSVNIDKASLSVNSQRFAYEEDPRIVDVHPRASILSGGILITVKGFNLNVVAEPRIYGQIIGEESGKLYAGSCAPSDDGLQMLCESPDITNTSLTATPGAPLMVNMHFRMDGVQELRDFPQTQPELSGFLYQVDPVFHPFSGADHVRTFYEDESHLDIKGEYLDLIDLQSDLLAIVGSGYCNVTLIGTTVLLCAPDKPDELHGDEIPRKVEIHLGNLKFPIGFLQYAKREPNLVVAGLMGSGLAFLCLLLCVFVIVWMKKTHRGIFRKKKRDGNFSVRYTPGTQDQFALDGRDAIYRLNTAENPYSPQNGQIRHRHHLSVNRTVIDDESRRLIDDANLLIDRDNLLLLEIIGQGHFGCVYRGFLKLEGQKAEAEVAVKTLKSLTEHSYTSSLDGRKFLQEALRMQEFDHPNILRLIGITLDKEEMPLVILPFMQHGDLLSYIRDETNNPTVKDLMDFGIQISQGMAYLSNLKFVHRDLAARNCMLDDTMNVKVADFGLSRDIYERDYYSSDDRKAKLPVKWMALESLEKGIYNIKTDVWSYGVVLWELMTRGVCPYPEVDNWDIIKFLKSGRRMPQPGYCPDALYSIMLHCWNGDPKLRPPFYELVAGVKAVISSMEQAHARVGISASYINVPATQNYLYPQPSLPEDQDDIDMTPEVHIMHNGQHMNNNKLYTGSCSTLV